MDLGRAELSIRRQCELLGLPRSSFYYQAAEESEENLRLMRMIDEEYLRHPFLGSRRITLWLRDQGQEVNRKRIQRLMRLMGLEAVYPKRKTTLAASGHKVYPYLLRNLSIDRVNQVWSTDITYVPLRHGFMYLAAVMDWHSRYVLSWRLSNSLETTFCVEALEEALSQGLPEIFNSDQGSQFTSVRFTSVLEDRGVSISMDGQGGALDNAFIERLWRTVKYEDIYLKGYERVDELYEGLLCYFFYYNFERRHQSLGNQTPAQLYQASVGGE